MKYQQGITAETPSLSVVQQVPVTNNVGLANPAAVYCRQQGGEK